MSKAALLRACEKAGGQKPLAERIGTTQSQVWYWLERSKKGVPAEFVIPIETATGVPRHELRGDLYPLSPSFAPAKGSK
jgi:DNA-binding transcriptional regulator YdaS (Cro superfamily)